MVKRIKPERKTGNYRKKDKAIRACAEAKEKWIDKRNNIKTCVTYVHMLSALKGTFHILFYVDDLVACHESTLVDRSNGL